MNAVTPEQIHANAKRVIFAENQPEYLPLPAAIDDEGLIVTEWEPTAEELAQLLAGCRVRLWVWTGKRPLQPLRLEVAERET